MEQASKQVPEQVRTAHGRFPAGVSGNPGGRLSRKAQAAADESERRALERELLADINREPSVTERIAVETLSAQVIRARRMRADGRHSEAEMAERLVVRALGKLGIRQGRAKPTAPTLDEIKRLVELEEAERRAADAHAATISDRPVSLDPATDRARASP